MSKNSRRWRPAFTKKCCCENDRDCVKTQEERNCAVNFQALTKVRQRLTKDAKSFHTVWTGLATEPLEAPFLGEYVAKLCCLFLLNGNRISQQGFMPEDLAQYNDRIAGLGD